MLTQLTLFVLAFIIGAGTSELIRALSARGERNRETHGNQPVVKRNRGH